MCKDRIGQSAFDFAVCFLHSATVTFSTEVLHGRKKENLVPNQKIRMGLGAALLLARLGRSVYLHCIDHSGFFTGAAEQSDAVFRRIDCDCLPHLPTQGRAATLAMGKIKHRRHSAILKSAGFIVIQGWARRLKNRLMHLLTPDNYPNFLRQINETDEQYD